MQESYFYFLTWRFYQHWAIKKALSRFACYASGIRERHWRITTKKKTTLLITKTSIPFTASQFQFTSRFRGKTATVLPGSSANFAWSLSPGLLHFIMRGVKEDGRNDYIPNDYIPDSSSLPSSVLQNSRR